MASFGGFLFKVWTYAVAATTKPKSSHPSVDTPYTLLNLISDFDSYSHTSQFEYAVQTVGLYSVLEEGW